MDDSPEKDSLPSVLLFGQKKFDWIESVKDLKVRKALIYLIAVREGCCESLWKTERNPHADYFVSSMEVLTYCEAIGWLHQVYGEDAHFLWLDPESTTLKKSSPRWLLAICDGILSFVQARVKGY